MERTAILRLRVSNSDLRILDLEYYGLGLGFRGQGLALKADYSGFQNKQPNKQTNALSLSLNAPMLSLSLSMHQTNNEHRDIEGWQLVARPHEIAHERSHACTVLVKGPGS